jgi:hypothetical protein
MVHETAKVVKESFLLFADDFEFGRDSWNFRTVPNKPDYSNGVHIYLLFAFLSIHFGSKVNAILISYCRESEII